MTSTRAKVGAIIVAAVFGAAVGTWLQKKAQLHYRQDIEQQVKRLVDEEEREQRLALQTVHEQQPQNQRNN